MLSYSTSGSFSKTAAFLNALSKKDIRPILERYGRAGVSALASTTPYSTGLTAESWDYTIEQKGTDYILSWHNTNVEDGVPIAILIQYGHGTGTGGYIPPQDFINPALKPVFEQISQDIWKEIKSA